MSASLWIIIVIAIFLLGLSTLLVLGRGGALTRGRYGRLARLGRLGARLWTSSVGARVRRLFMARHKRAAYDEARRKRDAEAMVETMGQMKGAIMKVGQMLSFVSESVPAEYRAALESLQAKAPPMDFAQLRDVAERELGMPLERAFARFDEAPLASASIGQVHRAVLSTGEEVVVKIQYPGVAEAIESDLQNAGFLYRMIGMFYPELDPKPIVVELKERLSEELDYRKEAANQRHFAELYAGHPHIVVPRVFESHSTARVLTTEYIAGRSFADILERDQTALDHYAEILWRFVFGSIIEHGVFNGDPHPGNYIFTDDGKVVFLDYGCVKYFPEQMLGDWMKMIRAHIEGRVDDFRAQVVALGFIREDSPLTAAVLYEYFGYFYRPILSEGAFTFDSEYTDQSMEMVFKPQGQFKGMQNKLNMPPDFLFINRIQWGVYSILAQLGATGDWRAIHTEYLYPEASARPAA